MVCLVRIGMVEVVPLLDAVGAPELDELYPGVSNSAWEPYRVLYPDLFDDTRWRVPCNSYLMRSAGTTALVDTGLGKFDPFGVPERACGLLPALADHGVGPADIDTVFITHLHPDHVGSNEEFRAARFVLHRQAAATAHERADRPHIQRCVLPLLEEGRVDEIEDGAEVLPGVMAVELAGHDPGHTGLRIGSDAILIGDAVPHPAFLDNPDWPFVADEDSARCELTRRALLEEVTDSGKLVLCGHYPGSGIGRVTREEGRVVWKETA